jgi:hypothetical protein
LSGLWRETRRSDRRAERWLGGISATTAELTPEIGCYLIGIFFSFAPLDRVSRLRFNRPALMASQLGPSSASLVYSSVVLAANSFNPFIYFRL